MSSIRRKIIFGYSLLAGGVVAFALFAWADLRWVEQRIAEGIAVSVFQESALEMRRHEKNHFLYGGAAELEQALQLAVETGTRLGEWREAFAVIAPELDIAALGQALAEYRHLLAEQRHNPAPALAQQIRNVGHDISTAADYLAAHERTALAATVQHSQRLLFLGVGVVVILGIVGGQVLSRVTVRPLRQLEAQLKPIAAGDFAHFPRVSDDREIVSLTAALNRMLDELDARRRQVLHADKLASIGVLASGVAHEVNNPLGNISSSCQILLEELDSTDPATLREWLEQIDGETRRAQVIVRSLLDYARRGTCTASAVELNSAVKQALVLLRRSLRGVELHTKVPVGLAVRADAQRLQQVFINLIKNAADAGARHIHLSAAAATTANWPPQPPAHIIGAAHTAGLPGVVIEISDDGPGIPADVLPHVFDPFFTTREPGQGAGLGLYIVEEIISEHDGCVAAESPAAGGTRFTLWLPAAEVTP
jgi:signal transduction histidine kinase